MLVNAKEAAEAEKAVYTIDLGQVVMTGNVLLTQGDSTISGSLTVDLRDGTGRIEATSRPSSRPEATEMDAPLGTRPPRPRPRACTSATSAKATNAAR